MNDDKRLFLLDGHALVYRAHYAFIARPLINSKGWDTSAITGFVRTIVDLINNQKPTHLAVSFDLPGGTFRDEWFPEYKANRDAQPEGITFALPWIMKILEAWKIPILTLPRYEADDVIGTIAKKAEKAGYKVYMVTPDKDYGQLVSPNIFMYKPGRQGNEVEIWGEKEVCENWGIKHVDQVVDMLGLQGDSVDNIPGVPGIGPKTAANLLAEFGSVENLLENTDKVKGKNQERLREFADQALLSKKLAKIDTDAPIHFDEGNYNLDPFDHEQLSAIFKELEFRALAKQILGEEEAPTPTAAKSKAGQSQQGNLFGDADPVPVKRAAPPLPAHSVAEKTIENTPHEYHLADTPEKRAALIAQLSKETSICFDTETTNIDANLAELVGMSFSIKPHTGWYVPVPADQKAAQAIVDEFRPIFESEKVVKIGQNIKYDALMLKWYGVELKGLWFDTMIAHYLIEPELRHGMDYLAETYLKYKPVSIETLIGKGSKQLSMRDVRVERVAEYAAEDADVTLQLRDYFAPKLKEEGLQELYETMEEPLIKVIVDMEFEGIRIDGDYLRAYSVELEKSIAALEQKIYEDAGLQFNIASPKQIGEVLFDKMKIPYKGAKTKTGQYSTDEAKLTELAAEYPFVAEILNHRGLSKLKSTYVDALPLQVNPKTGRVHSSFNQALAATGRLSSNNPNLQNIPIKTPEGAKVREAFIPRDENHLLLSADYSQIELRIIAEISGDEAMIDAFQKGQDIHRATAAKVYGVPYEEVTNEQRRNAKTVNFSIIYGAGATNVSQQLGIKRAEAKELIDNYFKQYQGLNSYMEKTVEGARETGYVKTLLGRRRYLRDIDSRNGLARSNAERVAINTPIQGTAADLIKVAMINIHKALKTSNLQTKMILQVHDELVFDVPTGEVEKVKPIIGDLMRNAIPNLKVPILVEMGTGKNWLEAH
ncbi:MAG: DNA polymerase I [Lewinellaceae bacterium]|nr:DNA polymerase I [Saprospiraceae bacterium]MCB9337903.1 DNA polymerase I [Lewinellaceae bacterium]